MSVRLEDSPIGRGGVLAGAGAAGVVLASVMHLLSTPAAPGWPTVVAVWMACGAMLLILCRVAMPHGLRVPLAIALLATMLFAAARADLFGVHAVADTVGQSVDKAASERDAIDLYASGNPSAPAVDAGGGAEVALEAGRAGGSDWAQDINAAWGKRIGGVAANGLRITGSVNENDVRDGLSWVAIDWAISRDFESARCGRTSAGGHDRATIVQAIGEPMARAVARSINLGKVSCP